MAKKSGKTSTPAAKRRKDPKEPAAAADTAVADGPPAAVVEVGPAEGTAVETAGTQTGRQDGAGSAVPGAEAVADMRAARPPAQAVADAPERPPAEAGGDAAAAEGTARPKGAARTGRRRRARPTRRRHPAGSAPWTPRPRCWPRKAAPWAARR